MTDRDERYAKIRELIAPFNKKGAEIGEATRFQQELEWDSLTVMDFVASVESKFDPLIEQREALLETGLTDPFNLVMEKVESPTVAICNGRRTILLGTYNYMGMTFDPDVVAAGKQALDDFGSGTTGSRVLNGTYQGHKECEAALRDFYAMDHAMV